MGGHVAIDLLNHGEVGAAWRIGFGHTCVTCAAPGHTGFSTWRTRMSMARFCRCRSKPTTSRRVQYRPESRRH
jgi:hypothetical protein